MKRGPLLFALGTALLGLALWFGFAAPGNDSPPPPDAASSAPPGERPRPPAVAKPGPLPPPQAPPRPAGAPENAEWIAEKTTALNDLAWFDDRESLEKILAELRSPEPAIRQAALAAVVRFGSRDAIPHLRRAADEANEPDERVALAKAIEYLELPTLLESIEPQPADADEPEDGDWDFDDED